MKTKLLLLLTFIGFNSYSQQEASFYLSNLSGASGIVSSGDMLYVQSPKKIYKINTSLNTPDATTIYTPAADFYITNIAVIGNMIYLSEENYKADTDTSLGSRIVAINVNNLSNPINVIYSTTQYVSALAIRHNHIYFSSETAPDANDDFIVEIHKIDISIPNPTATVLISNLTSRKVSDMEFYSNNLLISVEGKSKVFGFDVTDETPVVSEYLSGLNSNKGIFVNGNHLFTTEDNKIVAKQLNTASSLATIAQNTTYKNTQDGASFNENFIDVALIGDTLYMTLKEEGKIVKATDNTLSNSNATVSIADGNFEQALIDLGFDTNGLNGNILKTDAEAITELKLEDTSNNATLKNVTEKISSLVGIEAMINLTYLDVYNNNLTAVDVSKNTKLITLYVGMNQLTALDVSKNLDLKFLYASSNNIKAFDASNNSKLEKLDLNQQANKLSALNIVGATNLRGLYLWKNELGSIDLSTLPNLEEFGSSDSELTALDISNNILLKRLWLTNNKISALDISNNKALLSLYLRANQLTAIDVSNNTDLEYLEVAENQLTTIDVSKNTLLERLYLHTNQITTVDVSNNPLLERLYLYENQLTAIDLTKNPLLKILWLENNQLTSVDLSNNPNIDNLAIGINPLSSLDVSNQKVMRVLTTEKTQISTIDLSANINLEQLWVAENANLTALDVSNNPKIWNLGANATGITELDLSKQKIKNLHGQNNTALTKINLASGFNGLVETINLTGNTNLTCVQVDDVDNATAKWTNVDSASIFNLDCGYNQQELITIVDANFEQALIDLGFDTNGLSGNILKTDAEAITELNVASKNITDLTGVEAMINITKLIANNNALTKINVSTLPNLTWLYVQDNQIITLDVSSNLQLDRLYIWSNKVTTIDLSLNVALTRFYADTNYFTTVDLSKNVNLINVAIANQQSANKLTSIDVSTLTKLSYLSLEKNNLTSLDLSKNTALTNVIVLQNQLTALDISNNTNLKYLWYGGDSDDLGGDNETNRLSSLDVTNNVLLKEIIIAGTQNVSSLDLSNNKDLYLLNANRNNISNLNVNANTKLSVLAFGANPISNIDLTSNIELVELYAWDVSGLTSLDLSKNTSLKSVQVSGTSLVELDLGLQPIIKLHAANMPELTKLNLKNTNNVNVNEMFLENNSKLTCIQVDDVSYATSNWTNITDSSVFNADCGFTTSVAVVHIPDANMKNALLADPFINSNGDNEIQVYEAEAVHDDITRGEYLDISDLTGIEAFINITGLNIKGNNLTSLDLSKNTKLKWVNLEGNKLASVDFSANTMLEAIYVGNNNLTTLDVSMLPNLKTIYAFQNKITAINVSQNKNLETLWLSENELSAIDISANTELKQISLDLNSNISTIDFTNNTKLWRVHLWKLNLTSLDVSTLPELARFYVSENSLTTLDITKNTKLTDLRVGKNPLTSLDVSKNTLLERIDIEDCDITQLDISNNINLKRLWVQENGLSGIDISTNTMLEEFIASHNNIVNVDISNNYFIKKLLLDDNSLERAYLKNDYNTSITDFNIKDNANLTCIAVDNATWSTTNWTNIDAGASFSLDCSAEWEVYTTDQNLSAAIVVIPGLDDDGDGVVTYEEAQAFTGDLDLSGKGITDATGLEAFSNARSINISGNDITDINKLLNGTFVVVASRKTNQRQAKSRATITGLQTLDVSNNKIENIDISKLSSLNTLTTLNVSNNKLTSLKINNGHNNALTTLNATGNPNLTCIQVDNIANANSAASWTKDATANYSTSCQAVLSVDDAFLSKALRLYPNPVKDILNIKLSNEYQIKKIQLFNVVGKLLIEKEAVQQLNVAQLPSGIYLLKVDTDKGRVVKKIMKK